MPGGVPIFCGVPQVLIPVLCCILGIRVLVRGLFTMLEWSAFFYGFIFRENGLWIVPRTGKKRTCEHKDQSKPATKSFH